MIEDGSITTYIQNSSIKTDPCNFKDNLIEFIIKNILKIRTYKRFKIGKLAYPRMNDSYIDECIYTNNINISRNINRVIFKNDKKIDISNKDIVFYNQPLYEKFFNINEYIDTLIYVFENFGKIKRFILNFILEIPKILK